MMIINLRLRRAQEAFSAKFGNTFKVKRIFASDGDLGDLAGMQFDSERCGGYLYFWSSGGIEYQLVDYAEGVEVVPITYVADVSSTDCEAKVSGVIKAIGDIQHRSLKLAATGMHR